MSLETQHQLNAGLDRFTAAIEHLATEYEANLKKQVEERRFRQLRGAEERIEREKEYQLVLRTRELSNTIDLERIHELSQLRQQLFAARASYADGVFTKATEAIMEFAASAAYEHFLLDLAHKLAASNTCQSAELRLRECDLHLLPKLTPLFPADCSFTSSSEIKLGGLMLWLPLQRILHDERLETRLEAQRRWFYEHSELAISW